MKRIASAAFLCFFALAVNCVGAWAQATAQISGVARDQSGAVLPGVEVTASQTATGINRMTVTNETGAYILPNLPLGPYKLEAALPGFRTFVQSGIVLQVNDTDVVNVVLEVGQVSEQVEVQANTSLVETRAQAVSTVMETARVLELPLNGRNSQELMLLSGGAVQQSPAGGDTFPGRLLISTAGSTSFSTEYTFDGIRHVDPWDGVVMPLPFPDALAEFKTETSGVSAQQTRAAAVSAVTKSGTNDIHGDLFEFVRNDLFTARNYFATKPGTLKRNQFGGTLGGPVLKNKLFAFGGYQGTKLRQDTQDTRAFVPTAAMLEGDFTTFASPQCNSGRQITLRAPFVNNRVDPGRFSPAAVKLSSLVPKTSDPCGLVTYGAPRHDDQYQLVARFDYQYSPKHSLFGRYIRSTDLVPSPFTFTPNNILNTGNGTQAFSNAVTIGSTYLISPTTVNAFRAAWSSQRQDRITPTFFEAKDVGINIYSYVPKVMNLTITSGFPLSGNPGYFKDNFYQLADDVSMTRGRHQVGFGVYVAQGRAGQATTSQAPGTFQFSGAFTGLGLADFLTGQLASFQEGLCDCSLDHLNYFGLYGQDTWQVKPRLTMSGGLRWSPILPIIDDWRPLPKVMTFSMDNYLKGVRSSVFVNAPPGFLYPGDAEFPLKNNGANADKPHGNLFNPQWFKFAPHLGLAWDVQGDGRTSLRASYGLSYQDFPLEYVKGQIIDNAPWGSRLAVNTPAGGFDNPWQGFPGGNPFPLSFSKQMPWIPLGTYEPQLPDIVPVYTQSWNLSLQRQVARNSVASVSYIGNEVTHLQAGTPLNMPVFIPGNADANGNCFINGSPVYFKTPAGTLCSTVANEQSRRTLALQRPQFANEIGPMGIITNGGTQSYNGVLLSVQQRLSTVNLNANYTLSHCIGDYASRLEQAAGPDMTYLDPNNRRKDRGNCEYDQRHTFNLTGLVEMPKFSNHILNLVGSGWRLSGVYKRFTTGTVNASNTGTGARTVTFDNDGNTGVSPGATDPCRCNIRAQRPDLLLPNSIYLSSGDRPGPYLNRAAFGTPTIGTYGNMGRAILRLPTTWQWDMALSRIFRVREQQTAEFRVEMFNVPNSFLSGAIDNYLSSSQFGVIRNQSLLGPRILQFALKYAF